MTGIPPTQPVRVTAWQDGIVNAERVLPEEVPVALTYDRVTFAVMLATPADLHDFAIGFSISEGIIKCPSEITEFEILKLPAGIECRMALALARRDALEARRRRIAGPLGCGLCGIDSLEEATRALPTVNTSLRLYARELLAAISGLPELQILNHETHAVHAAAFYTPQTGVALLREDVGRHNAIDKLIGAAARAGIVGNTGAVLLTSRVSIELIQKTAIWGAGILAAVSVPSARAVREADQAGITLIAVARDDGFEIFSHPERIIEAYAPYRSGG
jgi:FdhD protein